MPKVPMQDPQFSLNMPNVPNMPYTREFGRVGDAAESLGQNITQTSGVVTDQIVKAEANDAAANAFGANKLWADNKIAELKLSSPDGYAHDSDGTIITDSNGNRRTIADEFRDQADAHYQNAQSQMPNLMAQEAYKNRALPYFSDQTGTLMNEAQAMKVKAYDQNQEMRAKALGGDPTQTPFTDPRNPYWTDSNGQPTVDPRSGLPNARLDTSKFYQNLQDVHLDGINQIGNMHNATDNLAKFVSLGHSMTDETTRIAITNIRDLKKIGDKTTMTQDIYAWYDLLRGTDPESQARIAKNLPTFSSTMDPVKREVLMSRLLGMLPTAKSTDGDNFKHQYEDVAAATERGGVDRPTFTAMLGKIGEWGQNEKHAPEAAEMAGNLIYKDILSKENAPEFWSKSNAERAQIGAQHENIVKMGTQKWATGLKVPLSGEMGSVLAGKIGDNIVKTQNEIKAEVEKDPVEFAYKVRPEWGSNGSTGESVLPTGKAFSQLDFKNPAAFKENDSKIYNNFSRQFNLYKNSKWSDMVDHSQMPVSKKQGQDFASKLVNEPTAELAAADVKGIYRVWKKDAPGNIDQMVKDKSLPYQYRLMGLHLNDPNALTYSMSCLKDAQSEEAFFKANRGAENGGALKTEMIRDAVQKVSNGWVQGYTQGEPNSEQRTRDAVNIQNAIYVGALKELRDPNVKNESQAAQTAFQKLTTNSKVLDMGQQHFWQGDRPVPQKNVIPDTYNGKPISDSQAVTIAQSLDQQRHHFKLGDVQLPPNGQGGRPENDPDGSHYIDYINSNAKASFSNKPEPGHYFFYKGTDGYQYKVRNSDGSLKFVPLSKSLAPLPSPAPDKPLPLPKFPPGGVK